MESETRMENIHAPESEAHETEAVKAKKSRIIVRNLIYDIKDHHLRGLFAKFGKITDINIPLNPSTNSGKGFAFVQLENKNQSLKAIKELNEKPFKGRPILLDLACDKRRFELNKPKSGGSEELPKEVGSNEDDSNDEGDSEFEEKAKAGKSLKKPAEAKPAPHSKANNKKIESTEMEVEEIANKSSVITKQKDEDLSTSAFVRNISYEISEAEFREFFSQFGKVKLAKLVKNPETGGNKGTGFVKFSTQEERDAVVKISDQLENREMSKAAKPNDKKKAKEDLAGIELELGGRRMIVLPAMPKASIAEKMTKDAEKVQMTINKVRTLDDLVELDRNNKRKIYLAKIGLFEKTEEMNDFEADKRDVFLKEKIEKLKNPNFFVSDTRVALKNLPKKNFGDEELKEITKDFLLKKFTDKERKRRKFIKQCKVLMEKDVFDKSGLPKPKGIGFIEFIDHDIALKFMEYIQVEENFRKMSSTNRIPIVEFAIEDIRKMKKRDKIKESREHVNEEKKKNKAASFTDGDKKELEKKLKDKKNVATSYKLLLQEMIDNPELRDESKAREYLKNIKLRGLRQKIKKKIERVFEHKIEISEAPKRKPGLKDLLKQQNQPKLQPAKLSEEQIKAEREARNQAKARKELQEAEERKVMKKIRNSSKNKKKEKRKAEDHDDFDEMAEKYAEKLRKKVKWSS